MAEQEKVTETPRDEARGDERRRDFLKKAGKVAATTPVVTLLLSSGTKMGAKASSPSRVW